VYEAALEVLESGSARVESFVAGDGYDPFEIALTCGGRLDVLIEPLTGELSSALETAAEMGGAVATDIRTGRLWLYDAGGQPVRSSCKGFEPPAGVAAKMRSALRKGASKIETYSGAEYFIHVFPSPPQLLVYGAVEFAAALSAAGAFAEYRVTVCDARPVFALPTRFPHAHKVVRAWPHQHLGAAAAVGEVDERTAICVLTHDPKFDIPLLRAAFETEAGYIGAMGSRATCRERAAQLAAAGATPEQLARLHSPIGLDLGARTSAQTAVSIIAEILAVRNGRTGLPLRAVETAIHD
jgi:xanthine dehydrogenase accessory factor